MPQTTIEDFNQLLDTLPEVSLADLAYLAQQKLNKETRFRCPKRATWRVCTYSLGGVKFWKVEQQYYITIPEYLRRMYFNNRCYVSKLSRNCELNATSEFEVHIIMREYDRWISTSRKINKHANVESLIFQKLPIFEFKSKLPELVTMFNRQYMKALISTRPNISCPIPKPHPQSINY